MKEFFKNHKHGILGTLLIHMFVLIIFLIVGITTKREHINSELVFDYEQIDILEEIRKEKEEEIKKLIEQTNLSEAEIKNLSSDMQSNKAVDYAK